MMLSTPILFKLYQWIQHSSLKQKASHYSRTLYKTVRLCAPHFCPFCRARSHSYICTYCLDELKSIKDACYQCNLPIHTETNNTPNTKKENITLCGECQTNPPPYTQTLCVYEFNAAFSRILFRYKEQGDLHIIHLAINKLTLKVKNQQSKTPDVLLATPLHWRKQWKRGFNQSEYIARELSSNLKIPFIRALYKTRATATQKTLGRKERIRNLLGSFSVDRSQIENKHCAIIDDVITTGATVKALSQLCLESGANRVDIWSLARTPKR